MGAAPRPSRLHHRPALPRAHISLVITLMQRRKAHKHAPKALLPWVKGGQKMRAYASFVRPDRPAPAMHTSPTLRRQPRATLSASLTFIAAALALA